MDFESSCDLKTVAFGPAQVGKIYRTSKLHVELVLITGLYNMYRCGDRVRSKCVPRMHRYDTGASERLQSVNFCRDYSAIYE